MKKVWFILCSLLVLAGCSTSSSNGEDKTIKVGASTTPHAEILRQVEPVLKEQGYTLEITEFTDYNTPNIALAEGSVDANYFQHKPYLDEWLASSNQEGKLVSVLAVHFEPLGIYSDKNTTLDVQENAKIAIPNDATNGGRALKLLEAQNIIKLKDGIGIEATVNDIVENPKQVEIIPMQAEACATNIQDVDYSVINGNNALNAKVQDKILVSEDKESEAAQTYANIIAVQAGHENDEKIQALLEALNSETVKEYIDQQYNGIVVPLVPNK